MGILRDIFDIAHDKARDADFDMDGAFGDDDEGRPITKYKPVSYDSIVKQAKKGTMQFPLICTRTLDADDVHTIAKACEIDFASMLQVVFTMNQTTDTDNPQEFINQFHQNTNSNIRGAGDLVSLVFNSADVPANVRGAILVENSEQLVPYTQQFETKTVNEKFVPVNSRQALMTKTNTSDKKYIKEAKDFNPHQVVKDQLPSNVFTDNDVKKANDLAPTLMQVRILKERGEDSTYVTFICGVKAVVHPVGSDDMVDHITAALRERGKLFRFLQWTTGEISFFKDLLFNIDQAKNDVKEIRNGKASTWWRALKNIKASRRFHKWTRTGPVLPNATIVISMDEVEYIKANHGFDLMDETLGEKILKAYNLIQFIIVDPSAQVVYFMADGETRYRTVTYKGLERQSGQADKQFKEILRAANKLQ